MIAEASATKSSPEPRPAVPAHAGRDAGDAAAFPFGRARVLPGHIVLIAETEARLHGPLLALVEGIEIGRSRPLDRCAAGDEVSIPIRRFPFVPLPCEVRFSGEDGLDAAAPIALASEAEAVRLAGPGEVTCDDLRIENGIVTGTLTNAVNGLAVPVLVGQINGVFRQVQVGPLRMRDEGGSTCRLSLALEAGDLTETGATIRVHALPNLAPIAQIGFSRADKDALAEAVTRLEAKVAQLAMRARIDAAGAQRVLEEAVARQQTRLDAMTEYFAALVYDRGAGVPDDQAAAAEVDRVLKAFYETVRRPDDGRAVSSARNMVRLAPTDPSFGDDWHAPEYFDGVSFRWMPVAATILNPAADRRATGFLVSVFSYLGEVPPDVFVSLDGGEPVRGERIGLVDGQSYTVRIILPSPQHFGVARLISSQARRPSELDPTSHDRRILSFSVTGIRLLLEPDE
ncbi:hypothetical protein [Methylobacterium sp. WSM2598]|uniref:hypothetical protein n=1 Tax=Methylobacterium sp. WSM2598 TaxID=398261 RepID=UPI000360A6B0|nr:hypothetical protein [Methylobacterium sp. WSM2598]